MLVIASKNDHLISLWCEDAESDREHIEQLKLMAKSRLDFDLDEFWLFDIIEDVPVGFPLGLAYFPGKLKY